MPAKAGLIQGLLQSRFSCFEIQKGYIQLYVCINVIGHSLNMRNRNRGMRILDASLET